MRITHEKPSIGDRAGSFSRFFDPSWLDPQSPDFYLSVEREICRISVNTDSYDLSCTIEVCKAAFGSSHAERLILSRPSHAFFV